MAVSGRLRHGATARRTARLLSISLLASSGAGVVVLLAPSAQAATPGTPLSMSGAMEGSLAFPPGSWVAGGYRFTGGSVGVGVSFPDARLTLPVSCSKGGAPVATPISVPLQTGPWTPDGREPVPWDDLVPDNDDDDDDDDDGLAFQGAVRAPDLCAGKSMYNASGATFTAGVVSQSAAPVTVQFHYRVPAGKGQPNTNCADPTDPRATSSTACKAPLSGSKTVTPSNGTGGLSGLSITTSTPAQPAGHGTIPLGAIPGSALLAGAADLVGAPGFGTPGFGTPGFGTPGFGTPGFGTPGFGTPGFGTPGFGTPGFGTPLSDSVLGDPALGDISLAQAPVVPTAGGTTTSWEAALAGTALAGQPLQTVRLADVLALPDPPAALAGLTLGQLDLSDTDLRRASLGAYLLGGTPLSALPVPTGSASWCAYLSAQPYSCGNHPGALSASLLAAELGGASFASYYATTAVELVGLPLVRSPLTHLLLNNTDLGLSSLGRTATTALNHPSSFVTCTPSASSGSCDTLAHAQSNGLLTSTGTLGALLSDSPTAVGSLTLSDLLVAAIARQNLPLENVPTEKIVAGSPMPTSGAAYRIAFSLTCGQTAGLSVAPALPAGFRVIPATVRATLGTSTDIPVDVSSGGLVTPKNAVTCTGVQPFAVDLQAEPSTILGPTTAGATAAVSTGSVSVTGAAPVLVTKNFIVDNKADPANPATINTLYAGHVAKPGDLDYFSVGGLPAGTDLTFTLSHLPGDYDLLVYGSAGPQLRATPGFGTPGFGTPGFGTPGFGTPGFGTPGFGTPGFGTPGFGTAATDAATSFASADQQAPSSLDPDVPRLNLPVRGYSHQRGLTTESVTTRVRSADEVTLVQVSGYLGAYSASPYLLRVSATPPPTALPCAPRSYPHAGTAGALPGTPLAAGTQTLFLVNQQRLGALYGALPQGDAGTVVVDRLRTLSNDPSVKGVVVPVEGDSTVRGAYSAWDEDACNPAAADAVVTAINALVDRLRAGLPDLRNIVLVGIDDVIPYGRVSDLTAAYNEKQYSQLAYDGRANALSAASRAGFLLSDSPYGDLAPQPFLDSQLYVPQLAVGRLVETPSDILGQIQSYEDAEGVVTPTSAFVTGYSPFDKGAVAVARSLAGKAGVVSSSSQINSTWDRQDGIDGLAGAAHGYGAVNAHYDVYRALPGNEDESNPLTTADLPPSLSGGVQFTIGCHSGLSVPDIYVGSPGPAQLDWPQAMLAKKTSGYVGNTGYGLGDTDAIAYSEKLSTLFAENVGPAMTLGQAMSFAKQAYVASVGSPSVYDAKAVQEATFYGLPMWRVGAQGVSAKVVLPTGPATQPSSVTLAATPVTTPITAARVTAASGRGTYYAVGFEPPLAVPGQPLQPKTTVRLPVRTDSLVAHGAITEGLTSYDVSDVDPVYSTPIIDSAAFDPEPTRTQSYFPSSLQHVAGSVTPGGRQDTLTLVAGQFASGNGTTGTQRLYSSISSTVLSSDSTDFTAPRITGVEATVQGSVARFAVTTPDSDARRAVVLVLPPGGSGQQQWTHVELVDAGNGQWVGTAALPAGATSAGEYAVEVADSSGNVARSANKGQNFQALSAPGLRVSVSPPADPATGIYPSPLTVSLVNPAGTTATYSVDGGAAQAYEGPVVLNGDGGHTFTATSATGQVVTLGLPIDSNPPTVAVSGPVDGASYARNSHVSATVSCTSAVTLASCYGPPALDTSGVGPRTYEAVAQDVFGRTTTRTVSYTLTNATPTVTLVDTPVDGTGSTSARITYALADPDDPVSALTVACTLDGSATPCDQQGADLSGLTPRSAPYRFVVTVQDGYGGVGSATATWRVFAATTLVAQPPGPSFPNLSATLTSGGKGLGGQTVSFYAGASTATADFICAGTTDATGKASCQSPNGFLQTLQRNGMTAVFVTRPPFAGSSSKVGFLTP